MYAVNIVQLKTLKRLNLPEIIYLTSETLQARETDLKNNQIEEKNYNYKQTKRCLFGMSDKLE